MGERSASGSDAQGSFRSEFLGDAFPLILRRPPASEICMPWRDIVWLDTEARLRHLVDKQHRPGFGFPSTAGGVFVGEPPDLLLGQVDNSEDGRLVVFARRLEGPWLHAAVLRRVVVPVE